MKKINFFLLLPIVFLSFHACSQKNLDVSPEKNGKPDNIITTLTTPISKDIVQQMLALDNFRVLKANFSGSDKMKDKVIFDYADNNYSVNSLELSRMVKDIRKIDPNGHLVCLFGLSNTGFDNGKTVFSDFSLHFVGMDSKFIKISEDKIAPISILGTNSKASIKDTVNFSRLMSELNENSVFGFSKVGQNGIAYKVVDLKNQFDNYKHHPIYIYPSVNLDLNSLFTTLIFTNKTNLRDSKVAFSENDVFGDKAGSCCPPQY